jgi:hypothetical protein
MRLGSCGLGKRFASIKALLCGLLVGMIAGPILCAQDDLQKKPNDPRLRGGWWFSGMYLNVPAEPKIDPEYLIFTQGFCKFYEDSKFYVFGMYARKRVEKNLHWRAYPEEKPHRLELYDGDKIFLKGIYQFLGDKLVIAFYPQTERATREAPKDFNLHLEKDAPPILYLVLRKSEN